MNVRDYAPEDEPGWLRCRVLSFLGTSYLDDVLTAKPAIERGAELVVDIDGVIAGLLDMSIEGDLATIDTVAVHPDYQRRGLGTALLTEALARAAQAQAGQLDAWTRDDEDTLSWYRARGFAEEGHYLHVYADYYRDREEPRRVVQALPGLAPIKVFAHGRLEDEQRLRESVQRVHVCRRFVRPVA